MKNIVNQPIANTASSSTPFGDLTLAIAIHTSPDSILADASGNVYFADFAASKVVREKTIANSAFLFN